MMKKLTSALLALLLLLSCCIAPVSASEISPSDTAPVISETDTPTPDPDPEPEPEITFGELQPALTAETGGYNSILLSWSEVEGAVAYEIWTSGSAKGTYTYITKVTDALSYTRTGRAFNRTFYYKVRAINADGEYSMYSEPDSAKTLPSRVSNLKVAAASYSSIKVSWSKVAGASGYTIYRSSSENGTYTAVKRVTSGSTLSWTNSSLKTGKTYYYKVRAYRYSGNTRIYGEFSEILSAKPALTAPTLTLSKGSCYVKLSWTKVAGATGYRIYRATDPEGEYTLYATNSSSKRTYNNTGVVPGVTYYYKVAAIRSGAEGKASAVKSAAPSLTKPSSPKAASASVSSIKISWSALSSATGYVIYRSDNTDGIYEEIARTTSKSYTDTGLTLGKTYYYKVAGYRTSKGLTGVGSLTAAVSAKPTVSAPSISSVRKSGNTSITVAWNKVSGADGYYVYRCTSSGGTYSQVAKIESGDTLSFVNDGLTSNKTYYFKVRAYINTDSGEVLSSYSAYKSGRLTKKVAYLTFDDGPSCNTMRILDILDRYDVKATFFVIGKSGRDKEYKAIVDRGHTIALHTYSHNYAKVYASEKAFFSEIQKISDKVYNLTGVRSKIIRFPGGSSNTVYKKYCYGLMAKLKKSVPAKGYYYHDWNVSSGDASGNNIAKSKIIANVKKGCGSKTVVNILMHDTGSAKNTTVDALPAIIEWLLSQGYDIQPITESSTLVQH